jgi:hypothetical protein
MFQTPPRHRLLPYLGKVREGRPSRLYFQAVAIREYTSQVKRDISSATLQSRYNIAFELRDLSPKANYADRAAANCW